MFIFCLTYVMFINKFTCDSIIQNIDTSPKVRFPDPNINYQLPQMITGIF